MEHESHIAAVIVFASVAMFTFAGSIILFVVFLRRNLIEKGKQIEQLESEKRMTVFKTAAAAEERERERIARNLHHQVSIKLAIHKQVLEKHSLDYMKGTFNLQNFSSDILKILIKALQL